MFSSIVLQVLPPGDSGIYAHTLFPVSFLQLRMMMYLEIMLMGTCSFIFFLRTYTLRKASLLLSHFLHQCLKNLCISTSLQSYRFKSLLKKLKRLLRQGTCYHCAFYTQGKTGPAQKNCKGGNKQSPYSKIYLKLFFFSLQLSKGIPVLSTHGQLAFIFGNSQGFILLALELRLCEEGIKNSFFNIKSERKLTLPKIKPKMT